MIITRFLQSIYLILLLSFSALGCDIEPSYRKIENMVREDFPSLRLKGKTVLSTSCILQWKDQNHTDGRVELFFDRYETEEVSRQNLLREADYVSDGKSLDATDLEAYWDDALFLPSYSNDSGILFLRNRLELFSIISLRQENILRVEGIVRKAVKTKEFRCP
ncbi:MAG: hypothetical protein K1X36_06360 [Pyrinomonadaceae bacterium]|nr:hypothetical protein [Pyrinomonadaceae bacterium]